MRQNKVIITLTKTPGGQPENTVTIDGEGIHPREIMAACFSIIKRLESILESDPAQEINTDINEESDASVTYKKEDGTLQADFKNITKNYDFN